jgi:CheY-like chemotaxis protein
MNKLLIVDDEPDVAVLYEQRFRREVASGEFSLHFVFSAQEALAFMKGLSPFDLVLIMSDINMPGMNGLELLQESKKLFPLLKVVMVSAYDNSQYRDTANQYGADDYITKPVDFVALKATIRQLIAEG